MGLNCCVFQTLERFRAHDLGSCNFVATISQVGCSHSRDYNIPKGSNVVPFGVCYGFGVMDHGILPKKGLHRKVWVVTKGCDQILDPSPLNDLSTTREKRSCTV